MSPNTLLSFLKKLPSHLSRFNSIQFKPIMGALWSKEQPEIKATGSKRTVDDKPPTSAKRQRWDDPDRKRSIDSSVPQEPRFPKKKVALLIGYNGSGYQGLQFNPGATTIESTLFDALCKARAVSKANSVDPKKVQWARTARTDKGVHAAGNLVSVKMTFPPDEPDMVAKINSYLPDQIRVWGYSPTNRLFNAKLRCDSRVYEYLLPTHVFMAPIKKTLSEEKILETDIKVFGKGDQVRYVSRGNDDELATMHKYRISSENLDRFRQAMKMFEGSHNFHNYTIGRKSSDKGSMRYMINISVDGPILTDGAEWLSVKLHGQSFMLHQIRKMISMAILVVRSSTPLSIISKSFESPKINIPKAPATGLLLEHPVFDSYNRQQPKSAKESAKVPIDFGKYKDEIQKFKETFIYAKIFESERLERGFEAFLLSIDCSPGPDFSYLNPEGIIPENAIIQTKYTNNSASADGSDGEAGDDE